MQVLIVDSSELVIQRLGEMLSEIKNICIISKALSYEEAIKYISNSTFSLVLLDSGLGIGAINLLKKIKESDTTASVIILSNYYDDYIVRQCKSNGADFIFDKFFEFGKIPGVIDQIVANGGTANYYIN